MAVAGGTNQQPRSERANERRKTTRRQRPPTKSVARFRELLLERSLASVSWALPIQSLKFRIRFSSDGQLQLALARRGRAGATASDDAAFALLACPPPPLSLYGDLDARCGGAPHGSRLVRRGIQRARDSADEGLALRDLALVRITKAGRRSEWSKVTKSFLLRAAMICLQKFFLVEPNTTQPPKENSLAFVRTRRHTYLG